MSPPLALFLTVAFIAFLFWRDFRERPNISGALWLPLFWMLIIGSRLVSEWINPGLSQSASALEEGSPIDRLIIFGLIVSGGYVLYHRKVRVSEIVRKNAWLTLFLLYSFVAIFWSDFPLVAFKRWIKILGHPIMALIILAEPDPNEALRRLVKRCAYVLIPVSILFIKYYPDLGRVFDVWSGTPINTGITADKNALGYVCMVLGFFFVWHLMGTVRTEKGAVRRREVILSASFLLMISWLLSIANSKTPLVALLASVVTIAFLGIRSVNARYVGSYMVAAGVTLVVADFVFGIYASAIQLLGRDTTLTSRNLIWQEVLKVDINPLLGAGFESFWLGDRLERLWEVFPFHPNQAHNGYLETYLNLGLIGVFVLTALLIATFWKAKRELIENRQFGQFRMGLFLAVLIYNYTESTFKALHLVWFAFHIIALDYPTKRASPLSHLLGPYSGRSQVYPRRNTARPQPRVRTRARPVVRPAAGPVQRRDRIGVAAMRRAKTGRFWVGDTAT